MDLGGDRGDCTVTFGGDLVGDLGGEKAIMEVGRGFPLLQGMRPSVLERGVTEPVPLKSATFSELCDACSLGMSSDMRPSARLLSSGMGRRSLAPGERWRGAAGADDLLVLRRFSNWARREDTGFYVHGKQVDVQVHGRLTMDEPSMFSSLAFSMTGAGRRGLSSAGTGRYPIAAHRPPRSASHWALLLLRVGGEAVARGRACSHGHGETVGSAGGCGGAVLRRGGGPND